MLYEKATPPPTTSFTWKELYKLTYIQKDCGQTDLSLKREVLFQLFPENCTGAVNQKSMHACCVGVAGDCLRVVEDG